MGTVLTIHGALGESLALVYLLIAVGSYLRRRHGGLPMWLVGLAHLLIAVQVVLGTVLYIRAPQVISVWHPITGFLALAALGLTVVFRNRLGRANSAALTALIVAVLVVVNVLIARLR
jgi:putative Mn2+ efflux pump MntP